jgi:hypothetical protein
MAVRTFKAITVGSITESDSYPYDTKALNIRGFAVYATTGSGKITVKFKDGSTQSTPRMQINSPYEVLFTKEIASIESVGLLTSFDIELLKQGVS